LKNQIILRVAKITDEKILFDWANDTVVRNNAINKETIEWETHQKWFSKKLSSPDTIMLIAEIDNVPIGQIRFDYEMNRYLIDYSIGKAFRGKSFGYQIVKQGIEFVNKVSKPKKFEAWVKPENIASKRVFEKMGFKFIYEFKIEEITLLVYQYNQ
jgi:RimJ/RimL family protein N-acetyltransferase